MNQQLRLNVVDIANRHNRPVDETMELAERLMAFVSEGEEAPQPKTTRATRAKPQAEPEAPPATGEDAELDRELTAPAPPMPETATQVVDAGTGKAAAPEKVQMTMDDVRQAAAKLAAKDTPKLGEILKKYGAGKLSEVPKGKLADFAGEVMEALG